MKVWMLVLILVSASAYSSEFTHIKLNSEFEEYLTYINKWIGYFYKIPFVRDDPNARRKINLMLLERTVGGILLDTGSRNVEDKFANHLLKLQIEFFDLLGDKIESKDYL